MVGGLLKSHNFLFFSQVSKYERSSGNSFRKIVRSIHFSSKEHVCGCLTNFSSSIPWLQAKISSNSCLSTWHFGCTWSIHKNSSSESFFRLRFPLINWPIVDNFKHRISRLKFSRFDFWFGQSNKSRNSSFTPSASTLLAIPSFFMKRLRKVGRDDNFPMDFDTYFMISGFLRLSSP